MDETWHALRATPIRETRRRAAIVSELTYNKPAMVDDAERFSATADAPRPSGRARAAAGRRG